MTTEQHLFDLCTQLQTITGKNDKIAFIAEHKDDTKFLELLSILLDKLTVFGIQTKKLNKIMTSPDGIDWNTNFPHSNVFELLYYLKRQNTGRDKDVQMAAVFIAKQPQHLQEFTSALVTKTLKLGVTAKSVNKALGYNLIVEFVIQRGKSYADEKHKFQSENKLISEKFNGIRGICVVHDGIPAYKTRQNQIIEGLKDLTTDMTGVPDGVYEGELIVKDRHKYKLRQVLQETMKILASDDEDKKLDWVLFDHLTHEEFAEPETSRTYFIRKQELYDMDIDTDNVEIADTLYIGKDDEVIYKLLEEIVARGGEGLMANLDRPYKKDKTNHILKIKKKYTSDLRIIGFEEGKSTGKHANTLGAFLLEYKGNTVKCGVMPDAVRHDVWANQEKYLGKIVEITHEQESGNQNNDLLSLEYPVFEMMRWDKDEVSYAHE